MATRAYTSYQAIPTQRKTPFRWQPGLCLVIFSCIVSNSIWTLSVFKSWQFFFFLQDPPSFPSPKLLTIRVNGSKEWGLFQSIPWLLLPSHRSAKVHLWNPMLKPIRGSFTNILFSFNNTIEFFHFFFLPLTSWHLLRKSLSRLSVLKGTISAKTAHLSGSKWRTCQSQVLRKTLAKRQMKVTTWVTTFCCCCAQRFNCVTFKSTICHAFSHLQNTVSKKKKKKKGFTDRPQCHKDMRYA